MSNDVKVFAERLRKILSPCSSVPGNDEIDLRSDIAQEVFSDNMWQYYDLVKLLEDMEQSAT